MWGADTITVTKNEILYSLNKPDDFILAIVEFLDGGEHKTHYLRPRPLVSDYAIADWVQEGSGGRALQRRRGGQWLLILCNADGIKSAAALRQAGVPAPDATNLAERQKPPKAQYRRTNEQCYRHPRELL